jgi:hypothetical protein
MRALLVKAFLVINGLFLAFVAGTWSGYINLYPTEFLVQPLVYQQQLERWDALGELEARFAQSGGAGHKPGNAEDDNRLYVYTIGQKVFASRRDGEIRHTWSIKSVDPWKKNHPHLTSKKKKGHIHGIHVYKNGDVIINVSFAGTPYGTGLIKLDRNSNIQWVLNENTHHDVDVGEDGNIYAPWHSIEPREQFPCPAVTIKQQRYYDDGIIIISPEGAVREKIPLMKLLCESPYKAAFATPGHDALFFTDNSLLNTIEQSEYDELDPLHLNAVRYITAEQANSLPMADAGDLLLSFRNLNSVAIYSRKHKKLSWMLGNLFIRQHDPHFTDNGLLYVYDNRGASTENILESQVLLIDPVTQQIVTAFKPEAPDAFSVLTSGDAELLDNGNMLVAESSHGRVVEITPEGNILWAIHLPNRKINNVTWFSCETEGFIGELCQKGQ